jgi:3',5'-cyclic AMP phosphodiesterase CpdA
LLEYNPFVAIMPNTNVLRVFLCHSSDDKQDVMGWYRKLEDRGVDPWIDKEKILPGQDWELVITKAIRETDVVLVFLSSRSVNKRGFVQREIRSAVEAAQELPEDSIFIIPGRLEPINISEIPEALRRYQLVDLFESQGFDSLMRSLQVKARELGIDLRPKVTGTVVPVEVHRPVNEEVPRAGHRLGRTVDIRLNRRTRRNTSAFELPAPTGRPPYHLSLSDVLPSKAVDAIIKSGRMTFHAAGNTGGVRRPEPQHIVAMHMRHDFEINASQGRPSFFYHLGDVVYFFGELSEYYAQFYEPYKHYPAPIFGIPGNHDGAVSRVGNGKPLEGFMRNFCAPKPEVTPEAGSLARTAMTQPGPYWTLEAPFLTIVGLYSGLNGELDDEQKEWLVQELRDAPIDKALLLALHHPPYSADSQGSGSNSLAQTLCSAMKRSRRVVDAVLSAHVNNYQRFTVVVENRAVPYLVVGTGGYWNLHAMSAKVDRRKLPLRVAGTEVTLENYCSDRHGYMRLQVTNGSLKGEFFSVPRPEESAVTPAYLRDAIELQWGRR